MDLTQGFPEAERTIADGEFGRYPQAAAFEIEEQFEPGLLALAVVLSQANNVLIADLVGADDHQQTLDCHQLATMKGNSRRPLLRLTDRLLWVLLFRFLPNWRDMLVIVNPETVNGWH